MIFDCALAAAGDENHIFDSRRDAFFDGVLNQRLVHHRQAFPWAWLW